MKDDLSPEQSFENASGDRSIDSAPVDFPKNSLEDSASVDSPKDLLENSASVDSSQDFHESFSEDSPEDSCESFPADPKENSAENSQSENSSEVESYTNFYTVDKFMTEQEAKAAFNVLQEAGFSENHLSIKIKTIDPVHGLAQSQVGEGIKGGAIAGATFGGLVGYSLIYLANNLPDSELNPTFNPWLGLVMGALVGATGMGLIGGISGRTVSQTKPSTEGENLNSEYTLMLAGTIQDVDRAMAILGEKNV